MSPFLCGEGNLLQSLVIAIQGFDIDAHTFMASAFTGDGRRTFSPMSNGNG
jgi:hypothetical protein